MKKFTLFFLVLFISSAIFAQTYRSLSLQGATVNGSTQSGSAPEFTVNTGQTITGTYNVLFETDFPSSHVFPLACTPNWGVKENDYWQDQSDMSSGSTYSGNISLTAPSTAGTYYIIIAVNSEYNAGEIVSATHWGYGSLVWDDGNDLFDLSSTQIQNGINTGSITHSMLGTNGTYSDQSFGLTAIKLNVGSTSVSETNSSDIKTYPNPVKDILIIDFQKNNNGIVQVFNSLGQSVSTIELSENNEIDMSSYDAGIYFVEIKDNKGNILLSEKIMKE